MIKLSKRLNVIASLVDGNIIDIGCDHAYLDIYLTSKGYNCIAIDCNQNVIDVALNNICLNNMENKIDVILSDGLSNYTVNDSRIVVISGMGTRNICKILNNKEFEKINTLIIQSNNDLYELRKFVCNKGFYISNEVVVYDKKFYCIIKFERGIGKYKYHEYYFGPVMFRKNSDYLDYIENKYNSLLFKLPWYCFIKKIKIKLLLKKLRDS